MSELDRIYAKITSARGGVANIHIAFSQFPTGIDAHHDLYDRITLSDDFPLSRAESSTGAVRACSSNRRATLVLKHAESQMTD